MEDLSKQVQQGMTVVSAEGTTLGKVAEVWFGTSVGGPGLSEEETCIEVHRGFLNREQLFLPCRIIERVTGQTVQLNVAEPTIRETPSWHRKPSWIQS